MKVPIDYDTAPFEIRQIYYVVCLVFKIDIRKRSRKREYVEPRSIYFTLCKERTKYSMVTIASFLDIDHASGLHAIKLYNNLIENNKEFREKTKKALYRVDKLLNINYYASIDYLTNNFILLEAGQQRSILQRVKFYVRENKFNVKSLAHAK